MSKNPASSVQNEKKIASYKSEFKEAAFGKPQDIELTITPAHLYGQAYIMEQQGVIEGDPVYTRFTCPMEEITKLYINDTVKARTLNVQCDSNIKGVVHRTRILIPCLDNVEAVLQQIEEIWSAHMKKVEEALQKEKDRKRQALEEAKAKEQLGSADSADDTDVPENDPAPEAPVQAEETKNSKSLNISEIEESFKALKSLENALAQNAAAREEAIRTAESVKKSAARASKKNVEGPKPEPAPVPQAEETVPEPIQPLPMVDIIPEPEPEAVRYYEEEPVYEAAQEVQEYTEDYAEPTEETAAVYEEPVPEYTEPEPQPSPALSDSDEISLEDFQAAVRDLRSRRDSGIVSEEEYEAEKKKLLALLY